MARFQVKELVRGTSSEDGRKITFEIRLATGNTHTLVFDFAHADALGIGILQVAAQAYGRQLKAGLMPEMIHGDQPVEVFDFRVHHERPSDRILVQILAKQPPNSRVETGSFRLETNLAERMGSKLLERARDVRQRRRPN